MATKNSRYSLLPLGMLALGSLASCSLPPKQAWQQIQTRGLIPYVASEVRGDFEKNQPTKAAPSSTGPALVQNTQPAPAANTGLIGPDKPSNVAGAPLPPPSQIPTASLPVAKPVDGLAGYVRSPYTNPPRLVDVRGMSAGSKVVCPYTRKPFLVPASAPEPAVQPQNVASANPTPAPLPKVQSTGVQPIPQPTLPPSNLVKTPPTQPTKVAANTASSPTPPPSNPTPAPAANNNKPAPNKPAPAPAVKQTPPSAPAANVPAANEIPFGTVIPGRPGFVNSPFAAKHQLVDVTGLPTGMEVKCPYTGKLFRVPPQANNPGPAPKANP